MPATQDLSHALAENWPIWIVTITLVVAAVIDGLKLKVPNWITFPIIISGWIYSATQSPYAGNDGITYS
jgi:prepilin peptidase CpaA